MRNGRGPRWAGGAAALALLAAGCGTPAARPPAPRLPSPARWLIADPAARSATLTLVAGYDATQGGFNFDGYGKGQVLFTVPAGWRVTVRCSNRMSRPASCAVARLGETVAAFPGAASPNPVSGLRSGASATFSFTPDRAGVFRILSLVPGEQQAGLWEVLVVASGGSPSAIVRVR